MNDGTLICIALVLIIFSAFIGILMGKKKLKDLGYEDEIL